MSESEQNQPPAPPAEAELQRSLTTTVAIVATPVAAVVGPVAAAVVDNLMNRPPEPEPPKVELPPGVHVDE